jgi:hypothetical protein
MSDERPEYRPRFYSNPLRFVVKCAAKERKMRCLLDYLHSVFSEILSEVRVVLDSLRLLKGILDFYLDLYLHILHIHSPMKMEQTQCSETSTIKHHTPENNPKDYTQYLKKLRNSEF